MHMALLINRNSKTVKFRIYDRNGWNSTATFSIKSTDLKKYVISSILKSLLTIFQKTV